MMCNEQMRRIRPRASFSYSEEPLASASDRERFELEVIGADEHSQSDIDLALTWRELTRGLSRIVSWFFTEARCGLVLAMTEQAPEPALQGRRLEILESILCGAGQKTVAINLDLAPSTVALNAQQGLAGLGIKGRPSRVHPLLMQVAKAARERSLAAGSISFVASSIGDLQVIGVPRPDRHLVGTAPPAELDVVRLFFEGRSYAEIARARQTSQRTVANQLSAVFKRTGVSGRNELVHRLFGLETSERSHVDTVLPPTVRELRPAAVAQQGTESRTSGIRALSELSKPLELMAGTGG
jgi:DNA-binding NarL/FixJ family response regulator